MASEVIFIGGHDGAAKKLGLTVQALRLRVYRQEIMGQPQDIPRPFKFAGRWAWRVSDIDKWLDQKAGGSK